MLLTSPRDIQLPCRGIVECPIIINIISLRLFLPMSFLTATGLGPFATVVVMIHYHQLLSGSHSWTSNGRDGQYILTGCFGPPIPDGIERRLISERTVPEEKKTRIVPTPTGLIPCILAKCNILSHRTSKSGSEALYSMYLSYQATCKQGIKVGQPASSLPWHFTQLLMSAYCLAARHTSLN